MDCSFKMGLWTSQKGVMINESCESADLVYLSVLNITGCLSPVDSRLSKCVR